MTPAKTGPMVWIWWILACLLVPLTWWLWGPALLLIELWRWLRLGPKGRAQAKAQRQAKIEARSRRFDAVVKAHLVAHGLPDNPENRARVMLAILSGGRR